MGPQQLHVGVATVWPAYYEQEHPVVSTDDKGVSSDDEEADNAAPAS